MTPTLAFFNNKGGVGKTTLVYHVAHMLRRLGLKVLIADLDPQSNLTSMCLDERRLEALWSADPVKRQSILGWVGPIMHGLGDVSEPDVVPLRDGLGLIPGDFALSAFEQGLADAWSRALGGEASACGVLSAFHRVVQMGSAALDADVALIDMAPGLGAINRAALLAVDHVVTLLAPDVFSIQGLRSLGPALIDWRQGWAERLSRCYPTTSNLARGQMNPAGYLVMQAGMQSSRPVRTYQRWSELMPGEYHTRLLGQHEAPASTDVDPECLGVMRNYHSLIRLAQDAQKPMFELKPAEGAIGAHTAAVSRCREEFEGLAKRLLARLELRNH